MDTTTNTKLSTNYYQTRNTRRAKHSTCSIDIDSKNISNTLTSTFGSFDKDPNINNTFTASRNNANTGLYQNISCSFDPTDLSCVACKQPHNCLGEGECKFPAIIAISDQHMHSSLSDGNTCVATIRIEDASLPELVGVFFDIFPGGIPSNSVILLGSATSMLQQGSSGYIFDWLNGASKINSKWASVSVCPLPPLLAEAGPGQLFRTICEVGLVLKKIFGADPRGLSPVWDNLLNTLATENIEFPLLLNSERVSYTLPFPVNLTGPVRFENIHFTTAHSCPASVNPVSRKAASRLVHCLADTLNRELSTGLDPAAFSERAHGSGGSAIVKDPPHPPSNLSSSEPVI